METHVEFRSDRFPPLDGEQELINPDLWGKRLADFLRKGLRKHGFETEEPIAEDWGWVVPVINKEFRLWIGCGHYQKYPRRIPLLHRTAQISRVEVLKKD